VTQRLQTGPMPGRLRRAHPARIACCLAATRSRCAPPPPPHPAESVHAPPFRVETGVLFMAGCGAGGPALPRLRPKLALRPPGSPFPPTSHGVGHQPAPHPPAPTRARMRVMGKSRAYACHWGKGATRSTQSQPCRFQRRAPRRSPQGSLGPSGTPGWGCGAPGRHLTPCLWGFCPSNWLDFGTSSALPTRSANDSHGPQQNRSTGLQRVLVQAPGFLQRSVCGATAV